MNCPVLLLFASVRLAAKIPRFSGNLESQRLGGCDKYSTRQSACF